MRVAIEGGVDTVEHSARFDEGLQKILRERDGGIIMTFSPALPLARLSPEVTKLNELCVYNSEVVLDGMRDGVRTAMEAGIHLGMGTDASCPFATQYNMWREVWYFWKMMKVPTGSIPLRFPTRKFWALRISLVQWKLANMRIFSSSAPTRWSIWKRCASRMLW